MSADAHTGAVAVLRAPHVLRVLAGSLVGRLPSGCAPIALLIFARETMTIAVAGAIVAAYTAGMAVGQPLLARLADRWRQPPVMWTGVAVSTACFAVTVTRPVAAVAVLAAAGAGLGAPPFEACLRVLWKGLVGERLLHAAYTLDVTVQELIFIVGPLVVLAATGLAGPPGGLVATAAVQICGTALFATAPATRRWRGERAPRHWAGPLRSAGLRPLLAATLLVGAGVGSVTVAVAGYAEAEGSRSWAGWLLAAQATGALIGGFAFAKRPLREPRRDLYRVVLLFAAGYLPLLLVPPLPVMAVLLAVSGLMLPPVLTAVFLATDRVAPPGTAAESFAWVATSFAIGSAAGSAVDGVLLDLVSTVAIGLVLAPVVALAAAALLRLTGRPDPIARQQWLPADGAMPPAEDASARDATSLQASKDSR